MLEKGRICTLKKLEGKRSLKGHKWIHAYNDTAQYLVVLKVIDNHNCVLAKAYRKKHEYCVLMKFAYREIETSEVKTLSLWIKVMNFHAVSNEYLEETPFRATYQQIQGIYELRKEVGQILHKGTSNKNLYHRDLMAPNNYVRIIGGGRVSPR